MTSAFIAVLTRELRAYFLSAPAYVFIAAYVLASGLAAWNLARFFDTAIASLTPLFQFQPWFLAVFLPAVGMRLWSEDIRTGTFELYVSSRQSLAIIHAAKFIAGLTVLAAAIIATFPYWAIINYLGSPDNAVIAWSYVSILLIGALFLLLTMLFSALTQHQVIAFVVSTLLAFALLTLGLPNITGSGDTNIPDWLTVWAQHFSFLDDFLLALRGVISISSLTSMMIFGTILFLIALFALHARRQKTTLNGARWAILSCVFMIIAFPMIRSNLGSLIGSWRLDVSEYRENALSKPARRFVQNLKEPIRLEYFYNPDIGRNYPEIRFHADRVRALLQAFEHSSKGKLTVETINPLPFSEAEDRALIAGIEAVPTEGIEPLYFGLSGQNLLTDRDVISYLNPERDREIEFEIVSLISRLDQVNKPEIGILSGIAAISEAGGNGTANLIQSALTQEYQPVWLSSDLMAIPDTLKTVLLINPGQMSDYSAYQVEQFVLRGGKLIILIDPAPLTGRERNPTSSALISLIRSWGISGADKILVDDTLGLPITVNGINGPRNETQPLYLGTGPENFSRTDFLTNTLRRRVNFGAAAALNIAASSELSVSPLITSSDETAEISADDFNVNEIAPAQIRAQAIAAQDGQKPLAVRLSGRFKTAFPDSSPEPPLPDDPVLRRIANANIIDRERLTNATSPSYVVLIADTDFLSDAFYRHPETGEQLADNGAFFLNLLETFSGTGNLSALRVRPQTRRPMNRVLNMRIQAEEAYLSEQDRLETQVAELETNLQSETSLSEDYVTARSELRTLQRNFRADINNLEQQLRLITIWLPFALSILAGLIIYRIRKRRS